MELFTQRGELPLLQELAEHALTREFGHLLLQHPDEPRTRLLVRMFREVCERQATLMAEWPRVVDAKTKKRMKKILDEIQQGEFAKEFILENRSGNVGFNAKRRNAAEHPMEEVGARLRGLMPWLAEKRLVDRTKN